MDENKNEGSMSNTDIYLFSQNRTRNISLNHKTEIDFIYDLWSMFLMNLKKKKKSTWKGYI